MSRLTKQQAVEEFVKRDFNAVPTEWVRKIADIDGDPKAFPMWGTMWFVDSMLGEQFMEKSRVLMPSNDDIDLESIEDDNERKKIQKAIEEEDYSVLEEYVDEEMSYEHCILDKDGNLSSAFIYEVDGEYLVGVNGAGWNFYDGVWDRLYDTLDLHWHEES